MRLFLRISEGFVDGAAMTLVTGATFGFIIQAPIASDFELELSFGSAIVSFVSTMFDGIFF